MALNLDIVGKVYEGTPRTYTQDDVILYALSIGAGVDELDFVYEKNLKIFPSFASVAGDLSFMYTMQDDVNAYLPTVLHGEQKMIFHKPISPSGTIYTTGVINSVYDKGDKGAILNFVFEGRDEKGDVINESHCVIVDRSGGNFGGDRGPKTEKFDPPEGVAPDFRVEYVTSPNQAALYRLTGDKNPLHIEPDFAQKGGFEMPILHGMCTYGFTTRAIVHQICGGDPQRLKSFAVRFMNVVYPGETLIIEGWKGGAGKAIIRTSAQDGRVLLGNAVAEIS